MRNELRDAINQIALYDITVRTTLRACTAHGMEEADILATMVVNIVKQKAALERELLELLKVIPWPTLPPNHPGGGI